MSSISLFEEKQVRRAWNTETQKWQFAIVDIIAILTDSPNPQVYWRVMKKRLADEGNETVTDCHGLKMTAADGKQRMRHHRRRYPLRGWDILSPSFLQVAHSSAPRAARVLGIESQRGHKISTSANFK